MTTEKPCQSVGGRHPGERPGAPIKLCAHAADTAVMNGISTGGAGAGLAQLMLLRKGLDAAQGQMRELLGGMPATPAAPASPAAAPGRLDLYL